MLRTEVLKYETATGCRMCSADDQEYEVDVLEACMECSGAALCEGRLYWSFNSALSKFRVSGTVKLVSGLDLGFKMHYLPSMRSRNAGS